MGEVVAPTLDPEVFRRNMRALWAVDAELAMEVDAVDDEDRLPLEPTRSGAWTLRMPAPGGAMTYLHSRHDPVAEAGKLVEGVTLEERFCFVVLGFGLGYHVRALFSRLRGDAFIVCVEPSIALIATALSCLDYADIIGSGRLVILTGADKARLHARLRPHSTVMMLGAEFVRHPSSLRVAAAQHEPVNQAIAEYVTFTRMSLMTLVGNAWITCENIAMNLATYVTTPPIDVLQARFHGDPAIVISAGPSLGRTLRQLDGLKGRAVLVAVQTALKPLMRRGVVPDFVTSLDFHEISRQFFQGAGDLSEVHLVAEPKATWHVLDHYPGPISLAESKWAKLLIGDRLGARGALPAGATVAHLAFYLAVYLGCDPIIFVGQDLAFTGHVFYVPGVEVHQAWRCELNRFQTMEMKEWERIARNRPILRQVTGADGGMLYTDELLFTYLEQFEKDIAAVPARVINATGGGAKIRGTQSADLSDVIATHCGRPIDPAKFAYRTTTPWHDTSACAEAAREIEARLVEIDGIIDLCEKMIPLLKELTGLTDDANRFNRLLARVDELRVKLPTAARAYQIVNQATQMAELRRFSADRAIEATSVAHDAARAKRQLSRDIEFVSEFRDGAIKIRPVLLRALDRIRAKAGQP